VHGYRPHTQPWCTHVWSLTLHTSISKTELGGCGSKHVHALLVPGRRLALTFRTHHPCIYSYANNTHSTYSKGQLGLGVDSASRGIDPSQLGANLPYVNVGTSRFVMSVCAGNLHTCALLDDKVCLHYIPMTVTVTVAVIQTNCRNSKQLVTQHY
jgi:hypothetical protein